MSYVLRNSFPTGYVPLSPRPWKPGSAIPTPDLRVLLKFLPGARGIGGHTTRAYMGYAKALGRPIEYFTFVRDPVKRYRSHFLYQNEVMGRDWTFDAFLDEPRFANLMTRQLAGKADLDAARRLLSSDFSFVGLTSRFAESLLLLRHTVGGLSALDPRFVPKNAVPKRPLGVGESEATERIRERNSIDIQLYEFILNELYPRYVASYGASLAADVRRLETDNETYSFSRRRIKLWRAWRGLVVRPAEIFVEKTSTQPVGY